MDNFRAFLAGGRAMDRHFLTAPPEANLPMLLAIWNNDLRGADTQAVLPYDARLGRFTALLQQIHMESNGKRVRRNRKPVGVPSGTIIWGEAGNNAQHSFYQLLHQGTRMVQVHFLAPDRGSSPYQDQHRVGLINMEAQARALAFGQTAEPVRADLEARGMSRAEIRSLTPHKVHSGNRPSSLIRFGRLDPEPWASLGPCTSTRCSWKEPYKA